MFNASARDAVSVVIAVRNGAPFIAEAVNSALAQDPLLADVVVVDDGSTDGTRDVVSAIAHARVKLISNPGRGVSTARNAGAAASAGRWLLFLDADDRLTPYAATALLEAVRNDADAVAVYGDYERIDGSGRRIGRRFLIRRRQKPSGSILPALLHGNFIINGGVLTCRRDAFEQTGGFDPSLSLCEDWHLWCKLAATGSIVFSNECVMDYRVHQGSVMMGRKRSYENFLPAIEAIYSEPLILDASRSVDLVAARRQAEISLLTYCAAQAARDGNHSESLHLAATAIRRDFRRIPYVMSRVGGAAVGL